MISSVKCDKINRKANYPESDYKNKNKIGTRILSKI